MVMEVRVEELGAWIGSSFVRFDQSMEMILKAVVEAVEEQTKVPAVAAFAEASRILRRNSSSIPASKSIK